MLVYFAMLMFGILAIAALVIDVGIAIVTRRQMQIAADTAALTGLRYRDELPAFPLEEVEGCDCEDSSQMDIARRKLASLTVSYLFDDDFDLSDDDWPFGAGPIINLSEDTTGQSASQTISIPERRIDRTYKPRLRCNCANETHGDLVAGRFEPNPAFDPPVPDNPRIDEDADYDHRVFVPDSDRKASVFLARLRRTTGPGRATDPPGLDDSEGVSSSSPALPYLFGRGTMLDPVAKSRGIAVRASAIADARRVMAVGPPIRIQGLNVPGIAPFGLDGAFWKDHEAGTPVSARVQANGLITIGSAPVGRIMMLTVLSGEVSASDDSIALASTAGFPPSVPFKVRIDAELLYVMAGGGTSPWRVERGIDGTAAASHADGATVNLSRGASVGQHAVGSLPDGLVLPLDAADRYVPIYRSISGADRIIGFGQADMTSSASPPYAFPIDIQLTKESAVIASQNATAQFVPDPSTPPDAGLGDVLNAHANLTDSLLAPVLVR